MTEDERMRLLYPDQIHEREQYERALRIVEVLDGLPLDMARFILEHRVPKVLGNTFAIDVKSPGFKKVIEDVRTLPE